MAKPNLDDELLSAELAKQYKNVILSGKDIVDRPPEIISVSPKLDLALGGGIPKGSWVVVAGPPKHFKTTLLLSFAAKCQKAGMRVVYMDIECRLKKMNLEGIEGLDYNPPAFRVVRSTKNMLLAGQDFLKIALDVISSHDDTLLILDSLSAVCDKREMDEGVETELCGRGGPKLSASFCRIAANIVPVRNNIVCVTVHQMANISTMPNASKTVEKSGNAIRYQQDVKLVAKYTKPWQSGDKQIGQHVEWLVANSALGPPGNKVMGCFRYGVGVDEAYELASLGEDLGLVEKAGSWFRLNFLKTRPELLKGAEVDSAIGTVKVHGTDAVSNLLRENPLWIDALYEDVRKMLNGDGV